MTTFQAIVLGLVQGFTEFLPVSSSGHLVIFQTLFGFEEPPIVFHVLVHLATLVAVGIYFRDRFLKINRRQIQIMLIGTIPAVLAAFVIEDQIKFLFSSLWIVAVGLVFTASLLYLSSRIDQTNKKLNQMTNSQALIIGIFQALAILPGVSRSGSTVSAGLFARFEKADAFYFSFLLAVPAIIGAALLQIKNISSFDQIISLPNAVGFIVATLSGLVALKLLDLVITQAKLHYFSGYCLMVAFGIILYQLI